MEGTNYYYDYDDCLLTKLPMEILLHIFKYLTPMDLKTTSITCTRLLEATQHTSFKLKTVLNFYKTQFSNYLPPILIFLQSPREFHNIIIDQIDFGQNNDQFWIQFGEQIQELVIKSCEIREKNFYQILKELKNLRLLKIEKCRELFMSGRLFETDEFLTFPYMTSLGITHNRYLSDAIFNRIVAMAPNLKHLNMTGCHISFHKGLYRKFYPKSKDEPSESILTFHFVLQFILQHYHTIESLDFSETLIDGTALTSLSEIENLNLKELILTSCDQLTNNGITNLAAKQRNLVFLDLSRSSRLTDKCLLDVCKYLDKLETLKLRRCRAITDLGIAEIFQLKNLVSLDVSECENITGQGIINGIAQKENLNIKQVRVSTLNICQASAVKIIENFPNLTILDLSYCFNAVTEIVVQKIFQNLRWLRELNLAFCDQITDAAITGMSMSEKLDNYEISGNSKNNIENTKPTINYNNQPEPYRISLRSRAEEEIVRDAIAKKTLKDIYECNLTPMNQSNYSIDNLKGLQILNLTGCNKISDISLQYSFNLPELRDISLAKCQQISTIGINKLIKNCPALETVDLTECHNIDDTAIENITLKLGRLTNLYLERCFQLTDHALDSIAVNCKEIKRVDLRGCRQMCPDPTLRLSTVSTLREIAVSKPGPYVTPILINAVKQKPKPPPFPF